MSISYTATPRVKTQKAFYKDLSKEILYATKEAILRLENKWVDTPSSDMLHRYAIRVMSNYRYFSTRDAWFHEEARFGADWLASKGDAFLEI